LVKGFESMAAKKATRDQVQEESVSKPKAGVQQGAARKEAAATPLKTEPAATAAAPKKPAAQKAGVAPLKLRAPQSEMLKKINEAPEPGYRSAKKAEQRTIEALRERKLIKRGSKHKESGSYHYLLSSAGKRHLECQAGTQRQIAQSQPGNP
jgi:hypothetical protein